MSDIEQSRATKITELHNQLEQLMRTTLDKAIEIGGLLAEQKAELPHGQWGQWVADNLPFSDRVARDYMRFYERRDELKTANLADLTEARKYIAGPETKAQTTKQSNSNPLGALLGDNPKVRVTDQGIEFMEPLTFAEWENLISRAAYLNPEHDAAKWIIGDLMRHGEQMQESAYSMQWLPPQGKAAYIHGARDKHRKPIPHFVVAHCKQEGFVIREWGELDDATGEPGMTVHYDKRGVRTDWAFREFDMSDAELEIVEGDFTELFSTAPSEKVKSEFDSKTPDEVMGLVQEKIFSAQFHAARVCTGLKWFLEGGKWKELKRGFNSATEFLNTVDTEWRKASGNEIDLAYIVEHYGDSKLRKELKRVGYNLRQSQNSN